METLVPRAVARFYYRHPMDAILTELLAATGIAPVARVAAPNTVARGELRQLRVNRWTHR